MRPGVQQFRIEYASGQDYEPDFVVETQTEKIIAEVKRKDEINDDTVIAKARAATKWVWATPTLTPERTTASRGRMLIPHDAVGPAATLRGLIASHARQQLF
jgi:type III restriction enzyme